MKIQFLSLFLVLASLFLSACFEVKEEITLKKNGSGSYQMVIDFSEAMDLMTMFQEEGGQGEDFEENIDSGINQQISDLQRVEGITKVASRREKGILHLSYDFASVDALNEALQSGEGGGLLSGMAGSQGPSAALGNYAYEGKTFIRRDNDPFDSPGQDAETEEMVSMMMRDAKMVSVYHLPRKVKRMSNASAELSKNKKTVTLNLSFLDLMDGKANVGNEIRMK